MTLFATVQDTRTPDSTEPLYSPRWLLKVRLRLRKGVRNVEGKETFVLLKATPRTPLLCPVSQFLGLALADGVFRDLDHAGKLRCIQIPRGRHTMPVIMRNEKMKIPILRRWECNSGLSSTRAQTSATLSHNLQNLGQRSGFTDVLTAYSIRRGHGNKLDVAVSAAERRSRMSHRDNDVYNSAYISTLSAIDTQAIMLDEEREDDVFENMRTMTATRDAAGAVVVGRSVGAGPIVTGQTRCKQPTKTRGDMPRGQRRKYVRDQYESLLGASIFDGGRSSDILPGGVVAEREIVRMDIERRALALLKLDRARKNIADLTDMPSDQMTIERNAKCFADVAEVGMHLLYPDSKIDEQGRSSTAGAGHNQGRKLWPGKWLPPVLPA
ncbi:hypothetical protein C1H76_8715 [Elsinoe australis]|uniref:Uncharacterized protein n=1 Tax=Elsinoe australis TaxID=40998 RepID=A0A4U7AVM2_9PEZI|nr:hypothetical protein C1H76_8715 [Elsinoe australis]